MKKRIMSVLMTLVMVLGFVGVMPKLQAEAAKLTAYEIVARADDLYNLTWNPLKTIYGYGKNYTFYAGTAYHIPYGMPVNTKTFIGYNISVSDFIAQTKDANSKLYTSSSGYNSTSFQNSWYCPYYAMDCSTFVSYCWGLASRQTTSTLRSYSTNIGKCNSTNVSKLQVGDALITTGHVLLVTDVSNGQVELTEETPPQLKRTTYSTTALVSAYSNHDILRYADSIGTPVGYNPTGALESVTATPATVTMSGWAVDADDASKPIDVHFYLDGEAGKGGTMIASTTTGHDRGDGTYTGYSCTLYKSLPAGTHTLYAYGINIGEGDVALIGTKSFTVGTALASFPDDFKATIINAGSGKLLTASYDGTAKMYSQYANENMTTDKYTWHFMKAADGAYNVYTYYGGKTLEVEGKSDTDGAAILTTKGSTQRWFIVKEGGYYTLRPHFSSTRYLDVTGNSQSEGASLQLNTGNASAAQLFIINNLSNDKTKPAITGMKASDITKDGFTLTINCEDANGVKNVNVVTNTWQGEEYAKTYAAKQVSNKVWTVNVKTADFNTYGAFYSKATVYDYAGNSVTSSGLETKAGVYTVSFDANGGAVQADDLMIVYSFKYSTKGTLPTPTRTGYTFTGWYTAKTGGTKVTNDTKVSTAKDHKLYAQWTPASYTVTFDACEGTASAKTQKVTYLSAYGTLPTATRTGYTFNGWYTAKTGGTKVTKDTKVSLTKDHTLYAQWTPASYTVTFDACEGTASAETQKVTYLSAYGTLPTATRTGYTFNGWYTAKTGGTKVTKDTKVSLTKDHTLYAQWTKNPISGDVNNDGKLSIADAVMLQKYLLNAGGMTVKAKGDMNGDGNINIFDLILLKQTLVNS